MMKKVLLGTTAIVGAALIAGQAMAAEKPTLALSGFAKFEMDFVDQDDDLNGATSWNRGYRFEIDDFEIDFIAKAVADNGLEYGAKLEMQFANGGTGGNSTTDNTDEAMIWLEGNWGLLHLGNEDGAEDLMAVGGWSVLSGVGAWDGENFFVNNSGAVVTSAMTGDTDDATKVSYYTPSFGGFRVGASWTPDVAHFGGAQLSDDDGSQENTIAVAVEYKNTFGDVGVQTSARYVNGDFESNSPATVEDVSAWAVGAKLTFAGFSLGASYNDGGDSGTAVNSNLDATKWYDVGLGYSTGPYSVAIGYFHSETDITTTAEAEADYYTIGGAYTAAPGLKFYAEYDYVDLDDGTTATTSDNEANVFIVGTQVSF